MAQAEAAYDTAVAKKALRQEWAYIRRRSSSAAWRVPANALLNRRLPAAGAASRVRSARCIIAYPADSAYLRGLASARTSGHLMHADVAIQLASGQHAIQIAEMSRDYIEYGLGWGWTEQRIRKSIARSDTNVAVVLHGDTVSAFGIMSYEERHAHLQLLAVRPDHRRKGLASAVMNWLESAARAAGSERILVECRRSNSPARCLYLEHGYHEKNIEVAMYRHLDDGIHLEKWLRPRSTEGDR